MPQFAPGSAHVATPVFVNPKTAGFDYQVSLCMGAALTEMAVASFHIDAGQSKSVPFPVTMPATMGTYPVYLKVTSGGVLIRTFVATEDVVILEPVSETVDNTILSQVVGLPIDNYYNSILLSASIFNLGETRGVVVKYGQGFDPAGMNLHGVTDRQLWWNKATVMKTVALVRGGSKRVSAVVAGPGVNGFWEYIVAAGTSVAAFNYPVGDQYWPPAQYYDFFMAHCAYRVASLRGPVTAPPYKRLISDAEIAAALADPYINIISIKWDQMAETTSFIAPDFSAGSGPHIAIVTFQNPTLAGLDYQATFYLGNARPEMASASFHLNAGESKSISFSMIWPSPQGYSYPVWFKVTSGGVLIGPFFTVRAINLPSNTTLWGYDLFQFAARFPRGYGFRALDYISAGVTEVIVPFPGYPPDLLGWVSGDVMFANFYWGSSITGHAEWLWNYPIGTMGAQILGMQSGDIIIVNFATATISVSPARGITYPH